MTANPAKGLAAAAILMAAILAAAPGNALACAGGLGENCMLPGSRFAQAGTGLELFAPSPPPAAAPVQRLFAPLALPAPARPGVEFAAGNCATAAAQAAAGYGGQVIGAPRQVQQGGRTMCVVTVLIKDPTGKSPPTRRQVTVPAN